MEPRRQMEIQLGHMCNNRCVFCVSGQRTAMREAFPLEADPILAKLDEGYAEGMRKITILGGEPTIQPEFMNVVRHAVALGFEEIVLFTNGVKTARLEFLDEVLATGGNITFRLSFQGATGAAHERTTKKLGSFGRLVETMKNIHARGKKLTVNMCVVRSNYESVSAFPSLILPYGAVQLHLDMVRPKDTGVRTDEEMRDMIPRYSDMVPHLEKMIAGFPEGFDVNIGNLPYCIAPSLASWIHHDGEETMTIAINDHDQLSDAWNKYENKKSDKVKVDRCRSCVFDASCSGIYDTYGRYYGLDELVPVTQERLAQLDPQRRLFTMHLAPLLARLEGWAPPSPFAPPAIRVDSRDHEVTLSFRNAEGLEVVAALRRPQAGTGIAATELFALHLLEAPDVGPSTIALLRALFAQLVGGEGAAAVRVTSPVGEDAPFLTAQPRRHAAGVAMDPRLVTRLRHLRQRAPFGALAWKDLSISGGREAAITLTDGGGATVKVTLAVKNGQIAGGYQLGDPQAKPSAELVGGLRELLGALR